MNARIDLTAFVQRHRQADTWRELARAITLIENSRPWDIEIPPADQPIHCIGITGPPGVGKSTLTGQLIEANAKAGRRVGVLAVDPSSPISNGAILGDRIRMERQLALSGTFMRSVASRGSHGAIASCTRNVVRLLEATGSFDLVIVETVGAGQSEVAIAGMTDTVVLVTVPGLGDAVQAIKAGFLEVADIVVINMADKPGARDTARHLQLSLGRGVRVLQTVATEGKGVEELRTALDDRWDQLRRDGGLKEKRRKLAVAEAIMVAEEWVRMSASFGLDGAESVRDAVGRILEEANRRWQM